MKVCTFIINAAQILQIQFIHYFLYFLYFSIMKNASGDISRVMREFEHDHIEQDKLVKQFLQQWRPMSDIVEDLSKLHGVPLYSDNDGDNGDGGDG